MKTNVQLVPAILATSEKEYKSKLDKIQSSNAFDEGWVHIDLMDNIFVQNKSISADVIRKYPTPFNMEAHLMVQDPDKWIDSLIEANVKRIIFPVEVGNTLKLLEKIKSYHIEAGISINPQTPIAKVTPFIGTIDLLLVMSVEPGFGGQAFIPEALEKVKQASQLKKTGEFLLEVDGGITPQTAKALSLAGADNLVEGSGLLQGDILENLEKFWEIIYGTT